MKKVVFLLLLVSSMKANEIENFAQDIERNKKDAHKLYHAIKSGDRAFMQQVLQESSVSQEEQLKLMLEIQEKSHNGLSVSQLCKAAATFGLVSGAASQLIYRIVCRLQTGKWA